MREICYLVTKCRFGRQVLNSERVDCTVEDCTYPRKSHHFNWLLQVIDDRGTFDVFIISLLC